MATTEHPDPPGPLHPQVRYEPSDINTRMVAELGFGILAGTWLCMFLLYFAFTFLMNYRAKSGPPALVRAMVAVEPPAPRIQASPAADLQDLRAHEDFELHSYGRIQ
jgi:hypothetical protein